MKIRQRITNLNDQRFWEEFETGEIGRILNGEIHPRTLITDTPVDPAASMINLEGHVNLGQYIVKDLLAVFPNSAYHKRNAGTEMGQMVQIAKYKGFTTLVRVHTICEGAQLFITSLLNGVTATFEFFKYMPGLKIDIHGTPKTLARPQQVVMGNFTSPMGAVVGRMIKSIFPMVLPTPHGSRAVFVNCDDYILFKQFSSKGKSTKGRGLRFTLMLTSLQNKDFEWILETDLPVPEKLSLGKEDPSDTRISRVLRLLE